MKYVRKCNGGARGPITRWFAQGWPASASQAVSRKSSLHTAGKTEPLAIAGDPDIRSISPLSFADQSVPLFHLDLFRRALRQGCARGVRLCILSCRAQVSPHLRDAEDAGECRVLVETMRIARWAEVGAPPACWGCVVERQPCRNREWTRRLAVLVRSWRSMPRLSPAAHKIVRSRMAKALRSRGGRGVGDR